MVLVGTERGKGKRGGPPLWEGSKVVRSAPEARMRRFYLHGSPFIVLKYRL